jgi:putative nucleotidyltransferase with HDIG domain
VNRELVHTRNEDELLHRICQAVVGQQAYVMAWVGYVQHDQQQSIKVMAFAGHDDGYVEAAHNIWGLGERGMGPSGRAVRSATTQHCQDIACDPLFLPWREAALQRGYRACIGLPLLDAKDAVFGVLHVYAAESNAFVPAEVMLLEEMSADLAFGVETLHTRLERDLAWKKNEQHVTQLEKNLEDTVRAIATIVEMRDPYTAGHQVRVAALAAAIAGEMGLPAQEVHAIHLAGLLHDVGKIQVPAEILTKPGKISAIEYSLIQVHSQAGYDILKGIDFPWPLAQMVLQHHERMDGSGYPQGLQGEQILLGARILGVADVVEAMTSHRPYRSALGIDVALEEVTRLRATQFDARVSDACLTLFRQRGYVLAP